MADFNFILVYDVSRWGRFQDADESAYYEYICKRAGINVAYCAEQFENDGSPVSTIVKGVKRAMAGEYSRELSVTPSEQRSDTPAPKPDQPKGDPLEQIVRLEREMSQVQTKYKDAEQNYGSELLNLVVAKGYLTKLIGNDAVKSYIGRHAPEILEQFELVVNTLSMEEALQQEAASTSETPPPDAAVGPADQADPSNAQDG